PTQNRTRGRCRVTAPTLPVDRDRVPREWPCATAPSPRCAHEPLETALLVPAADVSVDAMREASRWLGWRAWSIGAWVSRGLTATRPRPGGGRRCSRTDFVDVQQGLGALELLTLGWELVETWTAPEETVPGGRISWARYR